MMVRLSILRKDEHGGRAVVAMAGRLFDGY